MLRRSLLTVLFLVLAAPLPALAQGAADPAERIQAALRRAESAGIPAALLESKVAEGRAKGIPMQVIATAVERRLAHLGRARQAMGAGVTAADLSVGADALAAGVSEEALAGITLAAPADRRAVAVAVLTQLVQQGEASERALERVRVALADGPEALRRLPAMGAPSGSGRDALARTPGGRPRAIPDPASGEYGEGKVRSGQAELSTPKSKPQGKRPRP